MLPLTRALKRMGPWPPTVVAFLGILAHAVVYRGRPEPPASGSDGELNTPATFSAAVLGAAAIGAFAVATTWAARTRERRLLVAFGAFLRLLRPPTSSSRSPSGSRS